MRRTGFTSTLDDLRMREQQCFDRAEHRRDNVGIERRIDVSDEVRDIEIRHRRDPPLRPMMLRVSTSSTECDDRTPHRITHSSDEQLGAVRDLRLDEVAA